MLQMQLAEQNAQRDSDDDNDSNGGDIELCQVNKNSPTTLITSSKDDETAPNTPESPSDSISSIESTTSNEVITNPLVRELFSDNKSDNNIPSTYIMSVANRIRKGFELRLTSTSQIALNDQNRWFSYITPVGLFQYNQEKQDFIRLLEPCLLEDMKFSDFMNRAALLDEATELCVNDELRLLQWQQLEKHAQENHGHTVLGYSTNEEVFLRFCGQIFQLGEYGKTLISSRIAQSHEFPPDPDYWEKQLLDWTKKPMVQDVTTSIRTSGQLLLLVNAVVKNYMQYFSSQSSYADYYNFYSKNNDWYLLITASVALLSFASLQTTCFDKKHVLLGLRRARLIMESIIGTNQNWTSYAPLVLPKSAVIYGILPAILYGFRKGRFDDNNLDDSKYINIANRTFKNTIELAFSYASTNSSFFYLGSIFLINSCFFYYKNTGNQQVFNKFNAILTDIQYCILAVSFMAHIMRYPYANPKTQQIGRYATNTLQGLSNVFLDNFSAFEIMSMITLAIFNNNSPTAKDVLDNSMYFSFQILTFLGSLLITFPNTPDIPALSILPKPMHENLFTKIYNNTIKGVTLLFSEKKYNTDVLVPASTPQDTIELTHI